MEEEETFTVHFKTPDRYDEFAQMSQTELACETESGSNWLFLDNQFVDAAAVREMDLTQAVQPFRMVAPLVGGPFCRAEIWNQVQEHWVGEESIRYSELYSPDWITYFCDKRINENFVFEEFISTHNLDVDYNRTVVKRIPKGLAGWYEAKIWSEETQNWVSEEIHLQAWLNSDDFLLYVDGEKIDSETAYKDIIDRISKRRDTSIKVIVNSYCER
ncbi:MAG: hypothetical protein ISR25_07520 [Candidatus Poseidoniaceae archaeon]|nr:hypothetical protein [Candidatus Poseidoniaceae archaeon]